MFHLGKFFSGKIRCNKSGEHCISANYEYNRPRLGTYPDTEVMILTQHKKGGPAPLRAGVAVLVFITLFSAPALAELGWAEISHPDKFIAVMTQQRCPEGFTLSQSQDTLYCLRMGIKIPPRKVIAHCDALADGVLGFSWIGKAKDRKYSCPSGATFRRQKNQHFCEFKSLFVPKNVKALRAYCHYLNRGYLGYSYQH